MTEPPGFDESWQQFLPRGDGPPPKPALAYPVSWLTLRRGASVTLASTTTTTTHGAPDRRRERE